MLVAESNDARVSEIRITLHCHARVRPVFPSFRRLLQYEPDATTALLIPGSVRFPMPMLFNSTVRCSIPVLVLDLPVLRGQTSARLSIQAYGL
jgi:hypothetical protein